MTPPMPITTTKLDEIRRRFAAAEARCNAGMRAQDVQEVVDALVDAYGVAHAALPELLREIERLGDPGRHDEVALPLSP